MYPEFIDTTFALIAASIIWLTLIVLFTKPLWKAKVDDYIAGRRHKRRERNRREKENMQARMYVYTTQDLEDTQRLFDNNNPGLARKI